MGRKESRESESERRGRVAEKESIHGQKLGCRRDCRALDMLDTGAVDQSSEFQI